MKTRPVSCSEAKWLNTQSTLMRRFGRKKQIILIQRCCLSVLMKILRLFLHKHIAQVLEEEVEENIDFYLTTKEILKNGQPENNIWEKVEEG